MNIDYNFSVNITPDGPTTNIERLTLELSDSVVLNNDNPVEISTLISVLESACKVKAFVWNNLELKPITKLTRK